VCSCHATDSKAFTLLEVLISIFILVIVLSTVFASYTATFRIIGETESQADIYQMARVAFERMSEDLQSVYAYTPETSKDPGFGTMNEPSGGELLSFVRESTTLYFPAKAHLSFGKEKESGQLARITYTWEQNRADDEPFSLKRKDMLLNDIIRGETTGDQPEEPPSYPLCSNLVSVEFKYFDDEDEESEEGAFPKKVSVSLEFVNPSDPETPFKFSTSIPIQVQVKQKDDVF
jgi:prepilin-type N-terminal cleavage/methylation domain-containing protein